MPNNKFWKWSDAVESDGSKLILEGVISDMTWWGDEITPAEFRSELKEHQGDLTVILNSGGGDVFAGLSIYNALMDYEGKVTVQVDGLAASVASIIAMAGDKIVMSPGSMMMIHKPWSMVMGDVNELEKAKEILNGIEDSIIPIYTGRTGLTKEEIAGMLEAETWMTAEQAVELGFADELIEAKKKSSFSDAIKNLTSQYAFQMAATEKSLKDFLKLSEEGEENVSEPDEDKESVSEPTPNVETETENEEVETQVETETETTEAVDPVESKQNNSTKKEVKMSEKEIAKDQVIEPKNQAPVEEQPKVTIKDYLKTHEAMNAFASILEANPGEMGGGSSVKVRDSWKDHLETKLGVTNPEIFLPTPLITAIQNAFEDGGEIWNRVAKVGADVWNAAWDTENDVNDNAGRGRGYNRADAEEKAEQTLTFDDRILRPQFVYKYITLNKEDIKEQRSTGALVTYILSELPQRIVREVERAIVLGDGRASDNDYKIKEGDPRGFYPILADATAGNFFAGVASVVGGEAAAEVVALALDDIQTPGEVVLIAKKGYATRARFAKNSEGDYLFPIGTKATDILGVNTIIEPDWFNDTNSPTYDGVVVVLSGYKVVGDTSIEGFQNFILKTNKQEYLQEIWAGGGLSTKKAAIAIPAEASS